MSATAKCAPPQPGCVCDPYSQEGRRLPGNCVPLCLLHSAFWGPPLCCQKPKAWLYLFACIWDFALLGLSGASTSVLNSSPARFSFFFLEFLGHTWQCSGSAWGPYVKDRVEPMSITFCPFSLPTPQLLQCPQLRKML